MAASSNAWFLTSQSSNVEVEFHIRDLAKMNKRSIRSALRFSGLDLRKKARKLIKDPPKTGRLYRIKGRLHRASAPGQAPANRTGKLRKSIEFSTLGNDRLEFGSTINYGQFLEVGTKKMQPRPYLFKTIEANGPLMQSRFVQELKKELLR